MNVLHAISTHIQFETKSKSLTCHKPSQMINLTFWKPWTNFHVTIPVIGTKPMYSHASTLQIMMISYLNLKSVTLMFPVTSHELKGPIPWKESWRKGSESISWPVGTSEHHSSFHLRLWWPAAADNSTKTLLKMRRWQPPTWLAPPWLESAGPSLSEMNPKLLKA